MHEKKSLLLGSELGEEGAHGMGLVSNTSSSGSAPARTRIKRRSAAATCLAVATVASLMLLLLPLLPLPTGVRGLCRQHSSQPSSKLERSGGPGAPSDHAPSELGLPRRASLAGAIEVARRQSASASASATTTSASATGTVLVDFQVHQPVLTPGGATLDSGVDNGKAGEVEDSCQVLLMDHVFAYSYGEPYIGEFVPGCDMDSRGRKVDSAGRHLHATRV